jgi:hypothetical protein
MDVDIRMGEVFRAFWDVSIRDEFERGRDSFVVMCLLEKKAEEEIWVG